MGFFDFLIPKDWLAVTKFFERLMKKGGTPEARHRWAVDELVKKGMDRGRAESDITKVDHLIHFLQTDEDRPL